MDTFLTRYTSLNAEQKEAVDTIYGPVLVIAGPGSGKTELLSLRVANILRLTDATPSNILCLTFTDKAAHNMRERLVGIIGQDAYRVNIHTFHSFGSEILIRYRYRLRDTEDLVPIDDIGVSEIFERIQNILPWDDPWKRGTSLSEIRSAIEMLKRAGITPGEYRTIVETNSKLIASLDPLIQKVLTPLFLLGSKKEEKREKVSLFHNFCTEVVQFLNTFPQKHGLQEGLASTLIRSLRDTEMALEHDSDTRPITAWKTKWLEKNEKGAWILKETSRLSRHISLISLYESYETALHEGGYIDFSDMILNTISLIETYPDIRANLAEQYQWIMIDEYQDTNDAQMRMIFDILSVDMEKPNIFAVGDDDQSIFKFQGANTKNIRTFHDTWKDTRLIILEKNYRSYTEIIDVSRTVMVQSLNVLSDIFPGKEKHFTGVRSSGGSILLRRFPSILEEIAWITDDIEKRVNNGSKKETIAVITKKNLFLEILAKSLLSRGISVSLSKDMDIFEDEAVLLVTHILLYLDSLHDTPRDDLLLTILSHPAWQIPRLTLWNISRDITNARKRENREWLTQLQNHPDTSLSRIAHFFIELFLRANTTRLEDMIDLITGANECILPSDYDDEPHVNSFQMRIGTEEIHFRSPIYDHFFGKKADERYAESLTNMNTLIDRVRAFRKQKGFITIRDFRSLKDLIEKYGITIRAEGSIGSEKTGVHLITTHKAKGLEWQHVYAVGLTEGQYKRGKISTNPLPKNLPLAPDTDDEDDVTRLVYTALTRARDTLTLTFADTTLENRNDTPLGCISPLIERFEYTSVSLDSLTTVLEEKPHVLTSLPYLSEERDFLLDRIEKNFVLSATALQNFLDITRGGPERFVANNILRFPQAKSISATYGSAMHRALEDFFAEYKRSGLFQKSILASTFEKEMNREGLSERELLDILSRGKEKLENLYGDISGRTYGELQLEYDFLTPGGGVYLDDIRLTGKIDRIEIIGDGRIRVTDYKTGAGFTSLDESGTMSEKIKKWKYRLQLTFYALLFSLSSRFQAFPVREYELFFIEKDAKSGEIRHIIEYIQEGEIERMKRLVRAVMERIRTLDFPSITEYSQDITGIRAFEEDLLGKDR